VRAVRAAGAALKATEQPIDTSTAAGKCFLDMLGVFAEFETNLRRERQLEGIAKAKAEGVYKGSKAVHRSEPSGEAQGRRVRRHRDREATEHWAGVGLSGVGGRRLNARCWCLNRLLGE
jgi:DNA invertase Pin-like site-specific DNA recombinase